MKRKANNLETIFEEKDGLNTSGSMSNKRFKRMLQFDMQPSESKIKKRRDKIKKIFGSIGYKRKRKLPMQVLLEKLNAVNNEQLHISSSVNEFK